MGQDRVTKIYTLSHPETGEVRYVGKTVRSLAHRVSGHVTMARREKRAPVATWIADLVRAGLRPEIALLTTAGRKWAAVEEFWIERFRREGYRLLNVSAGGSGPRGTPISDATRARISTALLGSKRTDEQRARMSMAQKGRKVNPETRGKISAIMTDKQASPEARRAQSERSKAYWADPENRAKFAIAKTGSVASAETRAKRSASLKAHYAAQSGDARRARTRAANAARHGT